MRMKLVPIDIREASSNGYSFVSFMGSYSTVTWQVGIRSRSLANGPGDHGALHETTSRRP